MPRAAGIDDLEQTERDDTLVHHLVRDHLPFDVLMVVPTFLKKNPYILLTWFSKLLLLPFITL